MKIVLLLVLLCEWSLAQYDSPTPPRPVIPGAIPAPRPQIRRIQGPPGGRGISPGIVRVRRPQISRQPPPIQLDEEDYPPLRSAPPQLPPARPVLPSESSLPPRPVEELPEEEPEYDNLELEVSNPIPSLPPPPPPSPQPAPARALPPVFRPSSRPVFRPERPLATTSRPLQEDIPLPTRQQFRQQSRPVPSAQPQYVQQVQNAPRRQPVQQQQVVRQQPAQEQQYPRSQKPRKPVAQVIHKFRDDNPDGSITWGYENDDGTFKEETIGVDCMVRGKYGYIDPDGVKREYTYTSGIPCDKDKERENEGFIDYQNNKYVLANGDSIDLQASIKNKARRPVPIANNYRN